MLPNQPTKRSDHIIGQTTRGRKNRRATKSMSKSDAVANGLAGAGGGIIAQIITYPLQTVPSFLCFALLYFLILSICLELIIADKHAPANRKTG